MTIPLVVLVVGLAMLLVERRVMARRWPIILGWWPRAIAFNLVQAGIAVLAGVAWDGFMIRHRPYTLDGIGIVPQALLGYLAITFVYYWWHRWRHEVPLLWRWVHQVHHSPARIEVITSFYKHPLEILLNSWLSTGILYVVVGVGPEACALAILITGLAELFYHWNVRTPYWLGFLVQRPESHCVHHQRDLHAFNYADLPLWDFLFGTLRNPRRWEGNCGFGEEREERLGAMLIGREVA